MSTPFDPYTAPQASLDVPPPVDPSNAVPPALVQLLAQTRPWVRLISVLFFVGLGLSLVGTVYVSSLSKGFGVPGVKAVMFVPMLIMMLLYIPPALFLWQYASEIRRLQNGGGMPALEDALTRQKSFWKYLGIFISVVMGLYVFFIVLAALFGAMFKR
jgi:hypothetical protein